MYSDIVLGVLHSDFEEILEEEKISNNVMLDTELSEESLDQLVKKYKQHVKETTKKDFPQDPYEQLWGAISAVFDSWKNQRAITYRKLNDIPEEWGTAVNIQAMVFGNMGDDCCTGVAFTRNPSTGDKEIYLDVKRNGGKCVLTKQKHKSGTDRIFEGLTNLKKKKIKYVLNLQGDEPLINISDIRSLRSQIIKKKQSIGTLACKIENKSDFKNRNMVKFIS